MMPRGAGPLAVSLLLVAGCGFHLRGVGIESAVESAEIREVGRVALSRDLARALEAAGVNVVESGPAEVTIELLGQTEDKRGISVTDRARTAEYELSLDVRYRVLGADATELLEERVARIERIYRLDQSNIVGSHEEEALVRREMVQEAVRQIVYSLDAATRARSTTGAGATR